MEQQAALPRIKWQKHELVWISLVTGIAIAHCCLNWILLTPYRLESAYLIVYNSNRIPFTSYFINVWLPQVSSLLIFYLSYLLITLSIIPALKAVKIIRVVLLSALLAGLILIGTNLAAYLAHPILFGRGFYLSVLFWGSHDPLIYVFNGFSTTMGLAAFIFFLAFLREGIILYFERRGRNSAYWISIFNQVTTFAVIYFSMLYLLGAALGFKGIYLLSFIYFFVVPSVFLVYMSNVYWLFPMKGETSVLSFRILPRLLLSTFLSPLPFVLFQDLTLTHKEFISFLFCWAAQLFVTTPLSWLVYSQQKDRILRLRGMEKELVKTQANLQFLRSQINPHFLFNALNTLYGIALREKSSETAKGIQMLGDMMRFMLHENTLDLIPMRKELEYMESYIALQKLRMQASPDITIEKNINAQHCDHLIAPMLLIPFIENAFKHGISLEGPSWIHLSVECDEKEVRFGIRNSLHPKANNDPEENSSGIGLKNVIERLNITYPGRHRIDIGEDGREFVVRLVIQP